MTKKQAKRRAILIGAYVVLVQMIMVFIIVKFTEISEGLVYGVGYSFLIVTLVTHGIIIKRRQLNRLKDEKE